MAGRSPRSQACSKRSSSSWTWATSSRAREAIWALAMNIVAGFAGLVLTAGITAAVVRERGLYGCSTGRLLGGLEAAQLLAGQFQGAPDRAFGPVHPAADLRDLAALQV